MFNRLLSVLHRPTLLQGLGIVSLSLLTACQPTDTTSPDTVAVDAQPLTFWYDRPAEAWTEALPLGNGRLGAMVFGGVDQAVLQLNEDTVWAGGPQNNVKPSLKPHLEKVAELVLANRHEEAQAYADEHIKSHHDGMPYQTVGNLVIDPQHPAQANDYRRTLDIGQALAQVRYEVDGVTYQRETFAALSAPVIVTRWTASEAGKLDLDLGFNSPMDHSVSVDNQRLRVEGKGGDHEGVEGKIRFTALVNPILEGGTLDSTEQGLRIRGADRVTVYTAMATNFVRYDDVSADPSTRAEQHLADGLRRSYEELRSAHIAAYRDQFDRVSLDLGPAPAEDQPTDQRLANFREQNDPHLAALYFQFGRYLLISSSQPGTQPANLQGIWNDQLTPPWDSKYTLNINAEMNYWPAESTNLSELHEPLFGMLKDLSVTGRESARELYDADGWMVHHNTDIWRITGQVDGAYMWGQWLGGAAWLSQHIGYRYHHTGNRDFLAEHYPILRDAARFYASVLTEDPDTGWLVLVPSNSPENDYLHRDDGVQAAIDAGVTMDNQLVFDLFSLVVEAAEVLGQDAELAAELRQLRDRLPPMQIGQHGQLQEWLQDWDSPEDKHRHVSHLYGLHPSNQISPYRTPELFSAVRTSMEMRGDESTGWSMGWKVGIWARLQDGNRAYKLLTDQIKLVTEDSAQFEAGGTYANMFAAHPPYQIDGNFGVTAGIAEMLVQSHDGAIHLLPALPDAWPEGNVKGLVTRGGFIIDMSWREGKVSELSVRSTLGGPLRLRVHSDLTPAGDFALEPVREGAPSDNPLLQVPVIKTPIIHQPEAVQPVDVAPSQLLETQTQRGQAYRFKG
ncbi:alpha-L-fucosidase 2 [Marinimicrobium koreense]|uniref:Alpha-L-fucosidase 2 n=1 Tax=Marinimicrobium koreense TaxID=306545 RepID=A0A3N1NTN9_9GAMM|nr:glycoside hydrolase family 95 protein [Marinimicrobium koreense]ROQ18548.1 alpha-L-fucosidase 2 [Marinimicrobium koreense]